MNINQIAMCYIAKVLEKKHFCLSVFFFFPQWKKNIFHIFFFFFMSVKKINTQILFQLYFKLLFPKQESRNRDNCLHSQLWLGNYHFKGTIPPENRTMFINWFNYFEWIYKDSSTICNKQNQNQPIRTRDTSCQRLRYVVTLGLWRHRRRW